MYSHFRPLSNLQHLVEPSTSKPLTRRIVLLAILGVAAMALVMRALWLQVLDRDFLRSQGEARAVRTIPIPAHRGMITDRFGEPLAVSAPVDSVWANPRELLKAANHLPDLARMLGMEPTELKRLVDARKDKEFMYLARRIHPDLARAVMDLGLPGVALQRDYRRFYPSGEVMGQLLGFTDIDDVGQEGLERSMDNVLRGIPGARRVIKDRLGRTVETVEHISEPRPGSDVRLSIDRRIQYLAYRALQEQVNKFKAKAGTAVIMDIKTGEVLAMVGLPSFNPNAPARDPGRYRNRAVVDTFEPGSTMKVFTITAALESGRYKPETPIDTRPGSFNVGSKTITDVHPCGLIDVARVVQKSSNVGAAKIALSLPAERLWSVFSRVGFGRLSGSGFPGEVGGYLANHTRWKTIEHATMSYGYGISVTALQLTRAYAVISDGVARPVTFLAQDHPVVGERVVDERVSAQLRDIMELVVGPGGTATKARVPGYRVGGKTGTARKVGPHGGYLEHKYLSLFVGLVPTTNPRLAMGIVIDEPTQGAYYGGEVAGPAFAAVMNGGLRLMDVAPDDLASLGHQVIALHDEVDN
ncbi:Peptidoglycan D,D-transpeptidase FtsI [Gammaproteobacteria bacterium]